MKSRAYQHLTLLLLSIVILISVVNGAKQKFVIVGPKQLISQLPKAQLKSDISPLGLKPKFGEIHGEILLANPQSACSEVENINQHEDVQEHNQNDYGVNQVFLMADDQKCLESVKAKNLMMAGARVAIIKKNINNTLHDKQIDIVHIPVIQLDPKSYDTIKKFKQQNPHIPIQSMFDFGSSIIKKKIQMEMWFSPTERGVYNKILELSSFIANQPEVIQFKPRFVFHSQSIQKQYIGCLSSGRYCPPEIQFQGKRQGAKIVAEGLRQIIINSRNKASVWFKYINYFTQNCLNSSTLWTQRNSQLCSQSAMRAIGLDADYYQILYKDSFYGERPQVDDNYYLMEQRQAYISQKIKSYPVLLINKNQYKTDDIQSLKLRICNMIHPDPSQQTPQCQKYTNPSFFSTGETFIGIGILIGVFVIILVIYKFVIHRKMKKQMKGEVDKTLNQYYRYMETFQEPDPYAVGKAHLVEQKVQSNQVGSVQLTQISNKKEEQPSNNMQD